MRETWERSIAMVKMLSLEQLAQDSGRIFRHIAACTAYRVRKEFRESLTTSWRGSAGAIYPLLERLADFDVSVQAFSELNDKNTTRLLQRCQSEPDDSLDGLKFQIDDSGCQGHEASEDTLAQNACGGITKLELATRLLLDLMITNTSRSLKRILILADEDKKVAKIGENMSRASGFRWRRLFALHGVAHPQMRCLASTGKIEWLKQCCPLDFK